MSDSPSSPPLVRQHLIDPEICIRCNTCEDRCPSGAISHDDKNYVVSFERCTGAADCIPTCPTGAIDSYRRVLRPYPTAQQLTWDNLPSDAAPPPLDTPQALPDEVARLQAAVESGQGGPARPPWSAAHPYVNLYTEARPALATVMGNHPLTEAGASCDIHHLVLDFGTSAFPVLEGQSVGILPPGVDDRGRPHAVRLYSVASPRNGERPGYNNLALTVKRVTEDPQGRAVHGVASNYLCDLRKGDQVRVVGPYGSTFLMPNHPGASLLMICTGTGAAPMRAMTERRRRRRALKESGELVLFFGARTAQELPYFGPLMKLPRDFIDVNLAFSRQPDRPRQYVQDLMLERSDLVARLLRNDDCYIYICGLKRMELGVKEVLATICRDHGLDWPRLLGDLKAAGRFHIETY